MLSRARAGSAAFPIPSVIRRRSYINVRQRREASGTKRTRIYMRDKFRCQYCGLKKSVGELTLDLSQLALGDATRQVQVKLGVGELHVILPPGPSVEAHGRVGVGEATLFDRHEEGAGIDLRTSVPGSGQGALQIDFNLGLGEGTVSRDE